MYVETAWFHTGVKMPGRPKLYLAISMMNEKDARLCTMEYNPQMQILIISSIEKTPWESWVPMNAIKFMQIKNVKKRASNQLKRDVQSPKRRVVRHDKKMPVKNLTAPKGTPSA